MVSFSVKLGGVADRHRLRATGVVNVENPVTQAVREGRFEELE